MKGYFRKRGEKWSFTLDIGKDVKTGKRKQKTVSGFKTKKEAEKACALLIAEIEKGNLAAVTNKITVEEFMLNFLDSTVKQSVATNTYTAQVAFPKNHILPHIGHIELNKLTPMDIQKLYVSLTKKGFSNGHIQNIGNLVTKTIRTATEWGYMSKDVAGLVKKPSYKKTKMTVWTLEESQRFLEATKNCRYHVIYLLALTTGMRKGEILGLQWDHVDFKNKNICVQQTIVYAGNKLYLKRPKTAAAYRTISLPDFVVNYLRQYKLKQSQNSSNLVVTGSKHDLLYPSVLDKHLKHDFTLCDVPKIRFHDFRHTHATILLQMGENPKVVQERLGHANINVTLGTYSHVLPNMQKAVAEKLNSAFNF
ncbi:tyrosine-type recombinase/integrase [Paenibacillus larvae]|uniref:Integrase n=8 Tax=root TaxID=1 RepID=A0A345ARR9_9CAUD|nr:tyrosine-type recombinase/integrase [Paenibacillus larvae]YP_009838666.1 integrase [Paenibacillus phage Yyerffej]YP_009838938.1 integrase [Paenibacillus phage Jacopo]AXF40048.1 site-specific integrase [Paenibacillus phage Bloom]AXF40407.1 site-specific integrase [Paenibacillus phage Genki]AXF42274.1 site-specific integrase [Paenibacillus phage Gryphonian]AXH45295.1 integrase [Paenibacillus phage Arcticfreeze]AXH45361.1 integrase [Paenibacillus phage DevRi]QVV19437.1 tyrosine integrase [P